MSVVDEHSEKHFRAVENPGHVSGHGGLAPNHDEALLAYGGRDAPRILQRRGINIHQLAHLGQSVLHASLVGRARHLPFQLRCVLKQLEIRVQ
jgi:hypothetical protein